MKNRNNSSGRGQMANKNGNSNQKSQRKQSRGEMRSEADVSLGTDTEEAGRERRE